MAIITVSRGSASGGFLLAQGLSERLGFELVSREDVIEVAAKFGVAAETLQETILKPLGFWERFQHDRRRYLTFVQEALCDRARKDRIIYYGNAGHLLLGGVTHVLCVRLIAPMTYRVKVVMERQNMIHDEAVRYIERMDRQRKEWTHFLYGVDWLDPSLYDLTVNLATLAVESAVDIVAKAVESKEFQTTGESRRAMEDLYLASRVRAALAADESTSSAEVEVEADAAGQVVSLRGKIRPASMLDSIVRVAEQVEGVGQVIRKDLDAPDLNV